MRTEDQHRQAPHPADGLLLLGRPRTWALELGGVGAASAVLAVGLPVLVFLVLTPATLPLLAILSILGLMFSMGTLGGVVGAVTGRALCGLLASRWPMPLSTLRWNLRAAGAAWGGLLSGGSAVLGLLVINGSGMDIPAEGGLMLSGLMLLVGSGVGAVLMPGLVGAYLQAWLDRFGRRTVLLVMSFALTGVGMLLPVLTVFLFVFLA